MSENEHQQAAREHEPAPMTATRLAAIRERMEYACGVDDAFSLVVPTRDLDALLAFAEAARPILEELAARANVDAHNTVNRRCMVCHVFGHEPLEHHAGCIAAQARALLAGQTAAAAPVAADVDAIGTRCSSCGGSGMLATPIELAGDPLECPACGGTGIRKNDWHEEEEGEW